MTTTKTTNLIFRIDSSVKEALRIAEQQAHRSIPNIVKMLIGEVRTAKKGSDTK